MEEERKGGRKGKRDGVRERWREGEREGERTSLAALGGKRVKGRMTAGLLVMVDTHIQCKYLSYASLEERGCLSAAVLYFQEAWECGANENGAETESDPVSASAYVKEENESVVEATIDYALCRVLAPALARYDGVAGDWGIGPTVAEVKKTDCRRKVVCLSLFPSLPSFLSLSLSHW